MIMGVWRISLRGFRDGEFLLEWIDWIGVLVFGRIGVRIGVIDGGLRGGLSLGFWGFGRMWNLKGLCDWGVVVCVCGLRFGEWG